MSLVRRYTKTLLLILCLSFASLCQAIGFGELKVYSYLGEPLYAEIELTGLEGIDTDLLKVGLADAKDFARAGIERPYFLTFVVFQTITYNNKLFVVVRTNRPVQTPFLEFLVELSWPQGNLIKEYTILLDPPPADLKAETRPKGVGQQTEEEKTKGFGESSIQQQVDLQKAQQQKAAAEEALKGVVREGGNKFSDQTFDLMQQKAQQKTQLVPGVVPEVLDESADYQKELHDYKAKEAAAAAKKASETLLQETVEDLETTKKELGSDLSVKQILAQEQKTAGTAAGHEEPVNFGQVIPPAGGKGSAQVASVQAATPSATTAAGAEAAGPRGRGGAKPNVPTTVTATAPKSNHMYLGWILSLLLIAAGVGIAIKRGMLNSILNRAAAGPAAAGPIPEVPPPPTAGPSASTAPPSPADVPFSEHPAEKLLDEGLEEFAPEEMEQIELSTPAQENIEKQIDQNVAPITPPPGTTTPPTTNAPTTDEALTKFEQEFENINLDELAPPAPTPEPNEVSMQATATVTAPESTATAPAVALEAVKLETITAGVPPNEVPSQPEPFAPSEPNPSTTPPPEYEPEPQEVPGPTPNPEAPPEKAESSMAGPTLIKEDEGGLRLSPEGSNISLIKDESASIIDNTAEIRKKLDLAKQYLDSGDKESARDLLRELIEVANDEQKVEAQILLSTIV